MKTISTGINLKLSSLFLFYLLLASGIRAQCNPTFANGCSSWKNQAINLNTINWTIGSTSCTLFNYTSMSTNLTAGNTYPMTTTTGNWCGSTVWVDFDQSGTFDPSENLYYSYSGAMTNTYSFNITIPPATPTGTYRMRVLAGWGTDGFTVSGNGYGGCGAYQYGNFDDFTLNISGACTASSSTLNISNCGNYTSPSGNYTWSANGTYLDTIPNIAGCDSLMTINLQVLNASAGSLTASQCGSFTSPSGNHTWTLSGTYADTLTNVAGCDSVIAVNLTILNSTSASIAPSACNSYTSPSGIYTWTSSGSYTDTIPSAQGCDSIITINLSILQASSGSISPSACGSYTSPGGTNYTSSGTYADVIPNAAGCDSNITINLTIHQATFGSASVTGCNSYTSPSGNHIWTANGNYSDTIPNAAGCDSILTINVTINNINTGVSQSGSTLISDASGATYQWIDCNNGNQPVAGETAQSFTPEQSGSYAVVASTAGCTDTSACFTVTITRLDEKALKDEVHLYPNPLQNELTIEWDGQSSNGNFELLDQVGRVLKQGAIDSNITKVDFSSLPAGVYLLRTSLSMERVFRVVKQ